MEKNYFLAAFLVISLALFSQSTSNLVVFSEDGLKFYLILNGIRQNETAQTNVRVTDLNQPYYSAKIIFEDTKEPAIDKKYLGVVDPESKRPLEVTYKIKRNNKQVNVLRFFSQVPMMQVMPCPPNVVDIHYNSIPMPAIGFVQVTQQVTTTTTNSNSNNVSVNMGGMGVNININEPVVNTTTTTYNSTTTTGNVNQGYDNGSNTPNYNGNTGCNGSYPMSPSAFSAARETIGKQSFDDVKLSTVNQILRTNCLSSAQIKEIMKLFSFEASRLEFAKSAYGRCVDPNNYFMINDAFEFQTSVEELNNSIR